MDAAGATEPDQGPLSIHELSQLEATLLPALERHHLRLLAHALRTLQQVQQQQVQWCSTDTHTHLPAQAAIETWLLAQPGLSDAPDFGRQLAEQLSRAGDQLEAVAQQRGVAPLELELEALITWARQQADQRLASAPPAPQPQPPAEVPAEEVPADR